MRTYFTRDASFATGVNYWASHAATEMWSKWDEHVVAKDLNVLAEHGVQLLRVFPLWPDFQPITRLYYGDGRGAEYRFGEDALPDTEAGRAGVSEVMMERFERFCDIALKNHIDLIVALVTGQMTYRLYMPPGLAGRDPISDPEAIMWEQRFVKYFVKRMKRHDAVYAWDFGNECNFMGKTRSAAEASAWMCAIADAIKREDPERPLISGMDGNAIENSNEPSASTAHACWSAASQAEHCDILTTHYYGMWRSPKTDPIDTIKAGLFPVAESQLYQDITGKPFFMEETGLWRPMVADYETAARHLRMLYWNLWATGNGGLLWWCAFDQTNQDIAPYGWDNPGVEHGMFGHDHAVRAAGTEMKRFREFLDALPFKTRPKPARDAVCILGDTRQNHQNIAAASFICAREAGFSIEYQYSHQPIKDAPFYLLPSACGKAGFTGRTWADLKKKIFAGAHLYISSDDMYLQGLSELTGAEVSTRFESGGEMKYSFDIGNEKVALTLPAPVMHRMNSLGGKVKGCDAEDRPVFFEHTYGKGTVFYLTFPIEKLMMNKPCAFLDTGSRDAWKIYRYVMGERMKDAIIRKNAPYLSVTEHRLSESECVCVLVNNCAAETADEVAVADDWTLGGAFSYRNDALAQHGRMIKVAIPPNSGICLLLRKSQPSYE